MPYSIDFDASLPRFTLQLCGFWDEMTLAEFTRDLEVEVARIERTHREFDTLIDAARFEVQSADVVEGFERLYRDSVKHGRSALVLASALVRLQARGVLGDGHARLFGTVDAAEAWLAA